MRRFRGFSVLEVMLALIVVSIGIAVLLTFSASTHTETKSKSTGNDYSIISNDILGQFVNQVNTCNANGLAGPCPIPLDPASNKPISSWSAYDYLCENSSPAPNTPTDSTCTNNKISAHQYTALKTAGIDLYQIQVSIQASESDS